MLSNRDIPESVKIMLVEKLLNVDDAKEALRALFSLISSLESLIDIVKDVSRMNSDLNKPLQDTIKNFKLLRNHLLLLTKSKNKTVMLNKVKTVDEIITILKQAKSQPIDQTRFSLTFDELDPEWRKKSPSEFVWIKELEEQLIELKNKTSSI